jgi:molybdopterin/thiamine biosynthesis adenylyltransferase
MARGLSDEELDTYSRQIALRDIGYRGQLKIRNAKVCVVGVGGLGSTMLTQLAGMGVGLLRVVDRDVVERANIHRQGIFDTSSLGMPKVEAAENRIRAINPDVEVEALPISINEANARRVVTGMDVVLDGLDSIKSRKHLNRACVELRIPYVFGAAIEMFGNASTIVPGETPCLNCLFPRETESLATCATVGVHPSLVSIIASIEVCEAIRIITGAHPSLLGKLLLVDLRSMSFDTIDVKRSESCEVCGRARPTTVYNKGYEEFTVEEVCSTRGLSYHVISPRDDLELDLKGELPKGLGHHSRLEARYRLGIRVLQGSVEVFLMKSGVGIVRGAKDGLDALNRYKGLLKLLIGA